VGKTEKPEYHISSAEYRSYKFIESMPIMTTVLYCCLWNDQLPSNGCTV